MTNSLEARFKAFLEGLSASENLDSDSFANQVSRKKADYLLSNRRTIVEIKNIASDPMQKFDELMERLVLTRPDCPLFFGEVPLEHILQKLSDGKKVHQQITYKMTRAIQDSIEKADRQIRQTKEDLEIQDALGILVILNDTVYSLSPEVISGAAKKMLKKRKPNGNLVCNELDYIWLISETHKYELPGQPPMLPLIRISKVDHKNNTEPARFMSYLEEAFSRFCGQPFVRTIDDNFMAHYKSKKF